MKKPSDNEQWHMPKELRITNPKVAEAAAEFQKDMAARTASPLAHAGPQQVEMARAQRMVEHLAKDYLRLDTEAGDTDEAQQAIMNRMAECYATLGQFNLAAIAESRPEQKQYYYDIQTAINRPDSEWCTCPAGRDYVKAEVYSVRHERKMPLRACGGCKTLNVADLPEHLAQRASHEERARQAVAGLSPKDAAAKLKAMNHTSKQLLDI